MPSILYTSHRSLCNQTEEGNRNLPLFRMDICKSLWYQKMLFNSYPFHSLLLLYILDVVWIRMISIPFIWIHTLSSYVWICISMNSYIFGFVRIHILILTYEFITFLFVYELIYSHLCLNSYTITIAVAPYDCDNMLTTNTSDDSVQENRIEASMNRILCMSSDLNTWTSKIGGDSWW